jgi:hypothetical protein
VAISATAHEEEAMQCITVGTPSMSLEQVEAVLAQLDGPPEGMTARYIGTTDEGEVRIVGLWESRAHAERFFSETLGPVLARTLGPEPAGRSEFVGIEVARSYERQPVG